jgi:hypothetical protein
MEEMSVRKRFWSYEIDVSQVHAALTREVQRLHNRGQ